MNFKIDRMIYLFSFITISARLCLFSFITKCARLCLFVYLVSIRLKRVLHFVYFRFNNMCDTLTIYNSVYFNAKKLAKIKFDFDSKRTS